MPLETYKANSFVADKKNQKAGIQAVRLLHSFCSFGMAWHSGIHRRGKKLDPPSWCHGSLPGRRRDEAITIVSCSQWRLRTHQLSHAVSSNYGGRNAFGCTQLERLLELLDYDIEADKRYHEAVIRNSTLSIQLRDERIDALPQDGALMGFTLAPRDFGMDCSERVQAWNWQLKNKDTYIWLQCTNPIDNTVSDTGLATFVDDISRVHIYPERQAPWRIKAKTDYASDLLTQNMIEAGYEMNEDKENVVLHLRGEGAVHINKEVQKNMQGRVRPRARVLGPQISHDGKTHWDVKERIKACKAAWSRAGSLWHKSLTWRTKRCLFIALVQGAALSGLEGQMVTDNQYTQIDIALCKMLRSMKLGAQKTGHDHVYTMTTAEISKYWKMAPRLSICRYEGSTGTRRWRRTHTEAEQYWPAGWETATWTRYWASRGWGQMDGVESTAPHGQRECRRTWRRWANRRAWRTGTQTYRASATSSRKTTRTTSCSSTRPCSGGRSPQPPSHHQGPRTPSSRTPWTAGRTARTSSSVSLRARTTDMDSVAKSFGVTRDSEHIKPPPTKHTPSSQPSPSTTSAAYARRPLPTETSQYNIYYKHAKEDRDAKQTAPGGNTR